MRGELPPKEKIEELIETEGKIRGVALKIDADFVAKKEGEEGLRRLEEALAELGHPIKYKEIKQMDFYPLGLRFVILLLLKELFNFEDRDFVEMGEFGIKTSLLIRLSLKSFVSLRMASKQLSKIWKMYFSKGELVVIDLNEEKGYAVLRIKDFPVDSIHAQYLKGYFRIGIQMITRKKASCDIPKATFKGDDYTDFSLKW